ncbi:hypothetical protein MTO96_008729 [Rhipicephalus appendiculatus]
MAAHFRSDAAEKSGSYFRRFRHFHASSACMVRAECVFEETCSLVSAPFIEPGVNDRHPVRLEVVWHQLVVSCDTRRNQKHEAECWGRQSKRDKLEVPELSAC